MSRTFHRFERAGTFRLEDVSPGVLRANLWVKSWSARANPDDEVGEWRCRKCGATLFKPTKPDRRFLRKRGLGETCEEWALREVMSE